MFQSSKNLMRAVLDVVDDMLVGAPEPEPELEVIEPHPHRRAVRLERQRRAGTVTRRQMHCVCPARPPAEHARDLVGAPSA